MYTCVLAIVTEFKFKCVLCLNINKYICGWMQMDFCVYSLVCRGGRRLYIFTDRLGSKVDEDTQIYAVRLSPNCAQPGVISRSRFKQLSSHSGRLGDGCSNGSATHPRTTTPLLLSHHHHHHILGNNCRGDRGTGATAG